MAQEFCSITFGRGLFSHIQVVLLHECVGPSAAQAGASISQAGVVVSASQGVPEQGLLNPAPFESLSVGILTIILYELSGKAAGVLRLLIASSLQENPASV